jgi:hypothetical protein
LQLIRQSLGAANHRERADFFEGFRMRKVSNALIVVSAAVVGAGVCWAAIRFGGHGAVSRLVLWPLMGMAKLFPPPCFDRGPGEEPFCEGTPIQLFASLLGLTLSWLFYTGVAHLLLRRWAARQGFLTFGA